MSELEANKAILEALEAVQRADKAAREAGYGSIVCGALADAVTFMEYALNTAEGRT